MALEERDPHTGYLTTGHAWGEIKELNTPVPRLVWICLIGAFLYSVGYWILMPAWPIGVTYTKGLLGIDQRTTVAERLEQAARGRSVWTKKIESESFAAIQADPQLMTVVREAGRPLFGDNCAACHGTKAQGAKGFPSLTTASSLWGNEPEQLAETIRVGINSAHPQSRVSQMPAFGRDHMLQPPELAAVARFVRSLSAPDQKIDEAATKQIAAGKDVFANNCASCHGENAKGNTELGAPDLTDASWIYGGDAQSIATTLWGGRQGHMPTWEARLSPLERKILTLYVVDLRGAKP